MLLNKQHVEGDVIDVTPTHFITSYQGGVMKWSKQHYKLRQEPEPQSFPPSDEGRQNAIQRTM